MTILSNKIRLAAKDYQCNACEWMNESLCDVIDEMSFSEKRSIVNAKRNKMMVTKGRKYVYQTGIYDGSFYTFRAIPEIHDICIKYSLYEH